MPGKQINYNDTVSWNVPFDRERPIPFVKHCGKAFASITCRNELYSLTSELTANEKNSKFAKFYDMGPACPSEENIRATEYDNPMNPVDAFMITEYSEKMDNPGCHKVKTGYCVLPNGVGFATACTTAQGISARVMANYMEKFNPPEDIYYKAWLPGAHVRHYEDMAVEDLGFGMVQLRFIEGLTAEKIGMPQLALSDEYNIGITGANILCQPLHQPDATPIYMTELCYYRQMPDCYEERVTFWIGSHFKDGKAVLQLPDGKPVHEFLPLSLAKHSVWETATFMRNVLEFGKDCGLVE